MRAVSLSIGLLVGAFPVLASAQVDVEAEIAAGDEALRSGRLEVAVRRYEDALDQLDGHDPSEAARVRMRIADAYWDRLRWDEARQYLQQIVDDPAAPRELRLHAAADLEDFRTAPPPTPEEDAAFGPTELGYAGLILLAVDIVVAVIGASVFAAGDDCDRLSPDCDRTVADIGIGFLLGAAAPWPISAIVLGIAGSLGVFELLE